MTTSCGVVILLCAACSVDNRTLTLSGANGGLTSGGDAPAPVDAGVGDGGAPSDSSLPRCSYADGSGGAACETLVLNPGFSLNVAGWTAEDVGVTEGWVSDDATGDAQSGSLAVTNANYTDEDSAKAGTAGGGARQCLAITGGATYDLAADLFIPKGQGIGFEGNTYTSIAALSLFFYSDAGCQGQTIGNFTSETVQAQDQWVHVEGSANTPKASVAMAVRLATFKPFRQFSFVAQFDNIYVRQE